MVAADAAITFLSAIHVMKNIAIILTMLAGIFAADVAYAVTDREMDMAKAETAKLYLRWSNDGSGYLDDIKPQSMADLEGKLRAKEKENLRAFNAVKVPGDYASWDKERLVEFWSVTFFTSPGLSAEGKRAKDRVRRKLQAMTVSAPTAAKAEEPTPDEPKELPSEAKEQPADENAPAPSAETAVDEQENILADQEAIAKDMEEGTRSTPARTSHTWIYIVALVVLVGVVVWLMVFAANMMKKQDKELKQASASAGQYSEDEVSARLAKARKEGAQVAEENVRLRSEIDRLTSLLEESRGRERDITAELARLKGQAAAMATASAASVSGLGQTARPARMAKEGASEVLNVIYLGRANAKGQFVRGDRRPNPEHTIYRLDTKDGLVGTFRVYDEASAIDLALSDPMSNLAGGCLAENFEEAPEAETIVTENPGTAIFEGGCWKVLRKSRIRFE